MEGRGSDVEYWRGETHLGSSLPMSVSRFPCPRVVSCVHALLPVSARCCPCPRVVACICLRSWVVVFIRGRGW